MDGLQTKKWRIRLGFLILRVRRVAAYGESRKQMVNWFQIGVNSSWHTKKDPKGYFGGIEILRAESKSVR